MVQAPNSFLVIALRRIGDVLLTTPLIHSLRAAYPEARLTALVFRGTGSILAGNRDLDEVIEIPERPSLGEYLGFLRAHWRRYDCAISTHSGDRPMLLSWFTGRRQVAPLTGAPGKDWWRRLLLRDVVEPPPGPTHVVRLNLRLGEVLGIAPLAELVAPERPGFSVEEALGLVPSSRPYVVCHPVPMFRYKSWEDAQWRQLIARLLDRGFAVVISGGPGARERELIDGVLGDLTSRVVDMSGRLTFGELAEVLRGAVRYFGTDTSVTHLAAAVGIPVIAIYGPTDPRLWGPWPKGAVSAENPWQARGPVQRCSNVTIVQDDLFCVPCQLEGCDRHVRSASKCLQRIPWERVLDGASD